MSRLKNTTPVCDSRARFYAIVTSVCPTSMTPYKLYKKATALVTTLTTPRKSRRQRRENTDDASEDPRNKIRFQLFKVSPPRKPLGAIVGTASGLDNSQSKVESSASALPGDVKIFDENPSSKCASRTRQRHSKLTKSSDRKSNIQRRLKNLQKRKSESVTNTTRKTPPKKFDAKVTPPKMYVRTILLHITQTCTTSILIRSLTDKL